MRVKLAALLLLVLPGCAPARSVDTYFPLAVGSRWTYSLGARPEPAENARKLTVLQIVAEKSDAASKRYFLDESRSTHYLRRKDSISLSVSPGIWTVLLDGPLTLGHRFDGGVSEGIVANFPWEPEVANDPRIRPIPAAGYKVVTAFDRTITVDAGTFSSCLEITHIAGPVVGLKLYAPGVGMVLSEAWVTRPDGKRQMFNRQELMSFQIGDEK